MAGVNRPGLHVLWYHVNGPTYIRMQPIQAPEHPAFLYMIRTAACTTDGIVIPDRHQTGQMIIDMFKRQLSALRDRLKVRCHHITSSIPSERPLTSGRSREGQGEPHM